MDNSGNKPPAKKIGPEVIEELMDNRAEYGYAQLTAGKMADIIVEHCQQLTTVDGEITDLNGETVRRYADQLSESEDSTVESFKLGPRTVLFGREDDHLKVAAEISTDSESDRKSATISRLATGLFGEP